MWVDTTTLAADYARALNTAVLDRDGWPFVSCTPPGLNADFYAHARERHLPEPPPTALALAEGLDAFVRIGAPGDTRELAAVDPALIARVASARNPLKRAHALAALVPDRRAHAGARPSRRR